MLEQAVGHYDSNFLLYIDTQMRYHLGIDPDVMTDEEWAATYATLKDIREREAKGK